MTASRPQTLAVASIVIGLIVLLVGVWCMTSTNRNSNAFPDVVGTVVENKDKTEGAFKPEGSEDDAVVIADAQVSVRYTDIEKQAQEGVLVVMNGSAPKVGEQINVSYDPSHPDIVFVRKHSNAPIYLMLLGAILIGIGGFKLKRFKTPS